MSLVFCHHCIARMETHLKLNEWLKCYSCGFCMKKTKEQLEKEQEILKNQIDKTYGKVKSIY